MKNLRFYAVALAAFALFLNLQAQPKQPGGWQEKMMGEKIAFITMELELTPEEAQAFWPVYNQIDKDKQELQKGVRESYKALLQALNTEGTTDKDIDKLLDKYIAAKQARKDADKGDADKYRKVLSSKKVAKLFIAEENFRRHHIRNMKGGHQGRPEGKPKGWK